MERWHKPIFILFLLVWAANWTLALLRIELPSEGQWLEGLLPVMCALTSMLGLGRRLPLQNVLTATVLITALGSIITAVGALSGVPFGPIVYGDALGERLAGVVPWPLPLLWLAVVINGRGVARLIMRPWRKTNYYGFWVIGITCLLAAWFDFGFEPFAVKVKNYWIWLGGPTRLAWHTAPWVNFPGWFISCLGIMSFSIPWLIQKQPVKQPTDYHPLVVWLLMNLWVATGTAAHGLWWGAILAVLGHGVAAFCAIRGALRKPGTLSHAGSDPRTRD